LPAIQARAMADLASVHLSAGRLDMAAEAYERVFSFATARGLESNVPDGLGSYAGLNFQMGRYQKAITLAKLTIKHNGTQRSHLLAYEYQLLALAHTRLGEYGKADYWLECSLGLIRRASGPTLHAGYYGNLGWSQMVRGDLEGAELSLTRVLEILGQKRALAGNCNALKNLAEVALYRGDRGECVRLVEATRTALGDYPNQATAAELDLIETLCAFFYDRKDPDRLSLILTELVNKGCRYYSAVALFVALIESDPHWRSEHRTLLQRAADHQTLDETPLYRAIDALIEPFATVIGARNFVVMGMVQGKLHHVACSAVVARQC
jgi:tetratricopeptide (TPR) repeat protein